MGPKREPVHTREWVAVRRRQDVDMKTLKRASYAGAATLALALLAPSTALADSSAGQSATAKNSGNTVHRVSHALASDQQYTGASGYKWGKESPRSTEKANWAGSESSQKARSGYKWGEANSAEQTGSRWRRDTAEQTGSRWRRDTAEQTGSRWRRDTAEQTGSRWRRDTAEQTGSRWRRDTAEQAGSRWRR